MNIKISFDSKMPYIYLASNKPTLSLVDSHLSKCKPFAIPGIAVGAIEGTDKYSLGALVSPNVVLPLVEAMSRSDLVALRDSLNKLLDE